MVQLYRVIERITNPESKALHQDSPYLTLSINWPPRPSCGVSTVCSYGQLQGSSTVASRLHLCWPLCFSLNPPCILSKMSWARNENALGPRIESIAIYLWHHQSHEMLRFLVLEGLQKLSVTCSYIMASAEYASGGAFESSGSLGPRTPESRRAVSTETTEATGMQRMLCVHNCTALIKKSKRKKQSRRPTAYLLVWSFQNRTGSCSDLFRMLVETG